MVALADVNAHRNLDAQQLARFRAALYRWGDPVALDSSSSGEYPSSDLSVEGTFETVLVVELLYSQVKIPALLQGVASVCMDRCDVLVAYEQREGYFDAKSESSSRPRVLWNCLIRNLRWLWVFIYLIALLLMAIGRPNPPAAFARIDRPHFCWQQVCCVFIL
jgi:hypothetical protein